MAAVIPFIPVIASAIGGIAGSSKDEGPTDASVVRGFGSFGPILQEILGGAAKEGEAFQGVLPGLAKVDQAGDMQSMRNAIAMGLAPASLPLFGAGASWLIEGLDTGFSNVPQDLLDDFEGLLRPGAERSKEFLQADVLENAATLGQTRSSGTVESLTRGFEGIESGLGGNLAQIAAQLTPALGQLQLGGAGLALNQPQQLLALLQPQIDEAFRGTEFALSLPGQTAGGVGAGLSGIPFNPGTQGTEGGKGKGGLSAGLGLGQAIQGGFGG